MTRQKGKGNSDFRYDTGNARIPWSAVGEPVQKQDVLEMLRFLMPPKPGKESEYEARFVRLSKDFSALSRHGDFPPLVELFPADKNIGAFILLFLW